MDKNEENVAETDSEQTAEPEAQKISDTPESSPKAEEAYKKTYEKAYNEYKRKKEKKPHSVSLSTSILIAVCAAVLAATIACQTMGIYLSTLYQKKVLDAYQNVSEYSGLIEVSEVFDKNYIYTVDSEKINEELIYAYIEASGDRFAYYYTPAEWATLTAESQGNSTGIGVYVVSRDDGIYIAHVMKNSPALRAGIKEGDIIVAIDGQYVKDIGYNAAVDLVAGEIGTAVALTIVRDGNKADITAIRGSYEAELVIASTVTYEGQKYGYIKITEFKTITVNQFKSAVNALLLSGCKGLIFDVRGNPGGQLDSIVSILDFLLPEGPIVHITDVDGKEEELYKSDASFIDAPMVVLADGNTASAAELFTSSLKDYKKATVIGTKTFGKGCGQTGTALSNGGVLFVTSFLYNSPFSENYDKIGIYPDIEVALDEEYSQMNLFLVPYEHDAQLQRAVSEIYKATNN